VHDDMSTQSAGNGIEEFHAVDWIEPGLWL
jgi:hypothetical protein